MYYYQFILRWVSMLANLTMCKCTSDYGAQLLTASPVMFWRPKNQWEETVRNWTTKKEWIENRNCQNPKESQPHLGKGMGRGLSPNPTSERVWTDVQVPTLFGKGHGQRFKSQPYLGKGMGRGKNKCTSPYSYHLTYKLPLLIENTGSYIQYQSSKVQSYALEMSRSDIWIGCRYWTFILGLDQSTWKNANAVSWSTFSLKSGPCFPAHPSFRESGDTLTKLL